MTSDLVGTKDAAKILGVSTRTVKRLAFRGDELVPIAKMPGDTGAYVFHRAAVEAVAAARRRDAQRKLAAEKAAS
jgi:hypothetical protein